MKTVCIERIKELQNEGREYVMLKIKILDKEVFCIGIISEGLAFETLGGDLGEAEEIFNLLAQNGVSEAHLEEILHDIKMKIYF